ncbi:barstar family protein [Paenibacillus ehimensis]|uniref:barstar family protein n=1 Tax=Paenibacillus ehimensis TaxID=79264 RepID=UPI002DBFA707|nr:barstar family protein [Paenibacillus ehimensis]MEC0207375.1 barstar family protein [Paenibacillus ehimensis]
MYKYSLVDVESDLIIGNCTNIVGLSGSRQYRARNFYELIVVGLRLNEIYIKHCLATKAKMARICINMLSQDEKVIGSFFFLLHKPYYFHKNPIPQEMFNMEIFGAFWVEPSYEAMEIWRKWMVSKPTIKNTWSSLSQRRRLGWLEVVRMHHATYCNIPNNNYFLDMTHVRDSVSFYCALGEAMNGPGGYYGFSLDSLDDCFCGGFGATPPFVLHLCNGNFDELMHRDKINESEREKLRKIQELLILNQVTLVWQKDLHFTR